MNPTPQNVIVYHARGSFWKVIGNSNAAIALLVFILLLGFSFFDPSTFGADLLWPAILLELGLVVSWGVLIFRQTTLTYLTISTNFLEYSQPRLRGFGEPLILSYDHIQNVRIEGGNVVLRTTTRQLKLEFIGDARKVASILRAWLQEKQNAPN